MKDIKIILNHLTSLFANLNIQGIMPSRETTAVPMEPPPPPRQTRKQTTTSGSLSTGRTKEHMLANPNHSSTIHNAAQAKIFLVTKGLLPDNQDPDHSHLCSALLDLTFTGSGVNAFTADALRAIAIILDSPTPLPLSPQPAQPTSTSSKLVSRAQQTDNTDLESQLDRIQEVIDALHIASAANTTTSEVLTRTVDIARDDLHGLEKVIVREAVEELTVTPASLKDAIVETWQHPPPPQLTNYRDAVLGVTSNPGEPQQPQPTQFTPLGRGLPNTAQPPNTGQTYPAADHARANTAVKDRQILLNFDSDHPVISRSPTRRELIDFIQVAINKLDNVNGPVIQIKAITSTKTGSPILELNSLEAANWLKDPVRKSTFFEHLSGKVHVKERLYHLVVPFLPTSTKTDDPTTLRSIECESDLPEQTIVKLKWIKDPSRRDNRQRVAHAMLSISTPSVANHVIREGLYLDQHKYHPRKDRKEPLRCLKCQRWGHFASSCTQTVDTCGSCAHEHRDRNCNTYGTYYCVNCESQTHRSRDRCCPDFQRRCAELDARSPENAMPYFNPTDELWTQALLPPRPDGPIKLAQPPQPPHPPNALQRDVQRTLGRTSAGQLGINRAIRPAQLAPAPPIPRPSVPVPLLPPPTHNSNGGVEATGPRTTKSPRPRAQSSPETTDTRPTPDQASAPANPTPEGTPERATPENHEPQPFPAPSPLHQTPCPHAPKIVLKSLRPPPSSADLDVLPPLLSPTLPIPGSLPMKNTHHNNNYL